MSVYPKSQEDQVADYVQPVAASVRVDEELELLQAHEEDYLELTDERDGSCEDYLVPTDQRDDDYEICHVYEDLDRYTPIVLQRSQRQPNDDIPLGIIPPKPRVHVYSTTTHRADCSDLGQTAGYPEKSSLASDRVSNHNSKNC